MAMSRNSSNASQSRTYSSKSTQSANETISTHQDYRWDFRSEPNAREFVTAARPLNLVQLANRPRPTAASEMPVTLTDAIRKMNCHLLRSCALLAENASDDALQEADFALYLAEARKVYHLQSKSQLYRGLCLMELERWEEASTSFTRAASVRVWGTRAAELKMEAESRILEVERRKMERTRLP